MDALSRFTRSIAYLSLENIKLNEEYATNLNAMMAQAGALY